MKITNNKINDCMYSSCFLRKLYKSQSTNKTMMISGVGLVARSRKGGIKSKITQRKNEIALLLKIELKIAKSKNPEIK